MIIRLLVLFQLCCIVASCVQTPKRSTPELFEINRTVFVGTQHAQGSSQIMTFVEREINLALQQKSIDSSDAKDELRIYFASALTERYFKISMDNNNLQTVELFNLGYDRIQDSFFINVRSLIKWQQKSPRFNYDFRSSEKIILDTALGEDQSGKADYGSTYYIEAKKNGLVKKLLSNNPFVKADTSDISTDVTRLIKSVEKEHGFKFYEGWDVVTKSLVPLRVNKADTVLSIN